MNNCNWIQLRIYCSTYPKATTCLVDILVSYTFLWQYILPALIYPWKWNPCTVEKKTDLQSWWIFSHGLLNSLESNPCWTSIFLAKLKRKPKETHQVPCQLKLLATTATLLTSVWRLKIVFFRTNESIFLRFSFRSCCEYNYYRVGAWKLLGVWPCIWTFLIHFSYMCTLPHQSEHLYRDFVTKIDHVCPPSCVFMTHGGFL